MNTTHTTLKNRWYRINLNRQILHIGHFILHWWYKVVLCTVENLIFRTLLIEHPFKLEIHFFHKPHLLIKAGKTFMVLVSTF
jgi:hypothetical protein